MAAIWSFFNVALPDFRFHSKSRALQTNLFLTICKQVQISDPHYWLKLTYLNILFGLFSLQKLLLPEKICKSLVNPGFESHVPYVDLFTGNSGEFCGDFLFLFMNELQGLGECALVLKKFVWS